MPENIVVGKAEVEKEFKKISRNVSDEDIDQIITNVAKRVGIISADDFYNTIGFGGITLQRFIPRIKEELEKLGATVEIYENEATVYPAELKRPALPLSGHNDHRIVMAMSIILSKTGGKISGIEAVRKSYPAFFEDLLKLGAKVELL